MQKIEISVYAFFPYLPSLQTLQPSGIRSNKGKFAYGILWGCQSVFSLSSLGVISGSGLQFVWPRSVEQPQGLRPNDARTIAMFRMRANAGHELERATVKLVCETMRYVFGGQPNVMQTPHIYSLLRICSITVSSWWYRSWGSKLFVTTNE